MIIVDSYAAWAIRLDNMAHWHIEYFRLQEFERMAEEGRSLSFSHFLFP
jgi:hypothetical protein